MNTEKLLEIAERENELLRERVRALEAALCETDVLPIQFGLTPSEGRLFGALMKREFVSRDAAMSILYRDNSKDEADVKIVNVYICKIRKKLHPFGIEIKTRWGDGYYLAPEMKDIVRAFAAEAKGVAA